MRKYIQEEVIAQREKEISINSIAINHKFIDTVS